MKYNKKKRKEIYLKALEIVAAADYNPDRLFEIDYTRYVCYAIEKVSGVSHYEVAEQFPEVYEFRSDSDNSDAAAVWLTDHTDSDYSCKPNTIEGNELRQLVLIFAAELCDDNNLILE